MYILISKLKSKYKIIYKIKNNNKYHLIKLKI